MAEKKKASAPKAPLKTAGLLAFDFNNLMAEAIGAKGLTKDDLETIKEALVKARQDVENRYRKGLLPFMDLPYQAEEVKSRLVLAEQYRSRFENIVVLGIGGSALGTSAVFRALRPLNNNLLSPAKRGGYPRLLVADNIDPEGFGALLEGLDIRNTLFNVISKSGATAETMSQFLIVHDLLRRALGKTALQEHLLITTDPENGVLRKLVKTLGLSALEIPPGVGGRFSVFTSVGLAPLAAAGVDITGLLAGAAACQEESTKNVLANKAYLFAGLNWFLTKHKKIPNLVMMPYADALALTSDWFGQLWNESLGKAVDLKGKPVIAGQTAIKALGATDQHSQLQLYMEGPADKTVCFLRTENFRANLEIPPIFKELPELSYLGGHSLGELLNYEQKGTARALSTQGRPNMTITLNQVGPQPLGYFLHMLQIAAVVSGSLYNIDPLNQPGVELGKKFTYGLMGRDGYADYKAKYQKGLGIKKKYILS